MTDLSKYSDEELEQIASGQDLSRYSDEELMEIAGEKPKRPKTLLGQFGMEVTPEQWQQYPYQSAIAQTAHEATTIPAAHLINQLLSNYPRYAAEQAGLEYPEAETYFGKGLAQSAGIVGAAKSPLTRILSKIGLAPQTARLSTKVGRGALAGGIGAGAYGQPMEQRPYSAALGTVLGGMFGLGTGLIRQHIQNRAINKQVADMQKQFGIDPKKHQPKYLKTKIGELRKEKGIAIKTKADAVKLQSVKTIDSLKAEQKILDEKLLKKGTDLAKFMKDAGPKWVKKGTERYGQLLDDISNTVSKELNITSERVTNYLDDLIQTIENRGLKGKVLNDLYTLRANYAAQYPRGFVNFGQLKTQMSNIYRQMSPQLKQGVGMTSDDTMVAITKSKWMNYLEDAIPEAEKAKFISLQNKYTQFAQAKSAMGKAFHPYSGEYDMTKGINSSIQYAEQRKAEGINNLMKTLETGIDDYIPGVEDLKMKNQVLLELGKKKAVVKQAVGVTQRAKTATLNQINKEKAAYVDEVFKWEKKSNELLDQQANIQAQRRRLFQTLRNLGWIGAGIGGLTAIGRAVKSRGQE